MKHANKRLVNMYNLYKLKKRVKDKGAFV